VVGFRKFPKSACLFSAQVLVKVKAAFFQQAFGCRACRDIGQSKVRLYVASVLVRIKFFGFGKKQSHR
jgi:hypothetical protein